MEIAMCWDISTEINCRGIRYLVLHYQACYWTKPWRTFDSNNVAASRREASLLASLVTVVLSAAPLECRTQHFAVGSNGSSMSRLNQPVQESAGSQSAYSWTSTHVFPRKTSSVEFVSSCPAGQIEQVFGGGKLQQNETAEKNRLSSTFLHPSSGRVVVSNIQRAQVSPNNGSALFGSGISEPSGHFKVQSGKVPSHSHQALARPRSV
mmetsp:Transcript_35096/g.85014  ORF Transcript_35096/g.85014 Transcript_35096/m.85014 type:complete len:208 (-) Transcript_35096:553-1176(-)